MLTKQQKEEIVEKLSEEFKSSKAVVFSDFKGLKVKDLFSLRKELRQSGISLVVAKKTLFNLALNKAQMNLDTRKIEGQLAAVISSEDEVAAAKILAKTAKSNNNLKIMAGFLGNKALTGEEVLALSKLPSKEELLAKLVGTLNAPIAGFVNVLAGNLRGLVQVLKAIGESKV